MPDRGRITENVLPAPSLLLTSIRPPCPWTISLQMESPRPVPEVVALCFVNAIELLEEMGNGFVRNPYTGILDADSKTGLAGAGAHDHRAAWPVVLDGVAEQVEDDLFELVAIGLDGRQAIGRLNTDVRRSPPAPWRP